VTITVRNRNEFRRYVIPLTGLPGSSRVYYRDQSGYNSSGEKQQPQLGYRGETERVTRFIFPPSIPTAQPTDSGNSRIGNEFQGAGGRPSWAVPTSNAAYSKFREAAIGQSSQLGTFVAEGRKALGMVTNRALQLYHAYMALRKGRFAYFLRELNLNPRNRQGKRVRQTLDNVADGWLEYWFGWSPSLDDIYSSLMVLEKEIPSGRYHGSSSTGRNAVVRSGITYDTENVTYICKMGGTVTLTNPNVALAAQLGLVNPVSIAWNIVPFSFLADWVFDVGLWLESFTDFLGFSVTEAYTTYYMHGRVNTEVRYASPHTSAWTDTELFHHIRTGGITRPIPNLELATNLGASVTRAASAVALLHNILSGGSSPPRV